MTFHEYLYDAANLDYDAASGTAEYEDFRSQLTPSLTAIANTYFAPACNYHELEDSHLFTDSRVGPTPFVDWLGIWFWDLTSSSATPFMKQVLDPRIGVQNCSVLGICKVNENPKVGDNIGVFPCSTTKNDPASAWIYQANTGQIVLSTNVSLCLTVGNDTDPTTGFPNAILYACDLVSSSFLNTAQQFFLNTSSNTINHKASGYCLDITAGSGSVWSNVELLTCANTTRQQWIIDNQTNFIISKSGNQCATVCTLQ